MDFVALSLPEAAYLATGLAVQSLVRGTLRLMPAVILVWSVLYLLGRETLAQGHPYARLAGYLGTSVLLLALFWPEALGPFGGRVGSTDPSRVASYAASQDAGATVVTAQDTGLVPTPLRGDTLLPAGLRLLLQAMTQTHLALAQAVSGTIHRPFAPVVPMQWLFTQALSGDAATAVDDFVQQCFFPAKTRLYQQAAGGTFGLTFQDLLPWQGTRLHQELGRLDVVPGGQTGLGATIRRVLSTLNLVDPLQTVRCDVYGTQLEATVMAWLASQQTARGTSLATVFQAELGLTPTEQARFLLYREMLRAAGPVVQAPSLMGQYLVLRGAGTLGSMLGGAADGAVQGKFGISELSALKSGGVGAATGAIAGAANEFQRVIDGVSSLVGLAVWLTWWGPYMVGLVNLVLLGLFPIVLLWALFPQAQFQPVAYYFAAVFFTTATPLWWALVESAARLAAGPAQSLWAAPGNWLASWSTAMVVTALGMLLIPVVTGILIFGTFRAIGGLWRGGA